MKASLKVFVSAASLVFTLISSAQAAEVVSSDPKTKYDESQKQSTSRNHPSSIYYQWGQAQNGYGYCYEFNSYGQVLNGGQPVNNFLCEQVSPSYYQWATASTGYTYCYQFAGYGLVLNNGYPVPNHMCH